MTIKMFVAAIGTIALLSAPLECSKQADSKRLHGKPRKKFMSSCKKA